MSLPANDIADKITAMSEDSLRGMDRAIANWPAEFRAIIWDAVALVATQRADLARSALLNNET